MVASFSGAILRGAILLAALLLGPEARAQELGVERLERANARAMAAFRRAEVRAAKHELSHALARARRAGVHGASLARAFVSLGVVFAEGAGSHHRAVRAFKRALREDAHVVPEAGLRTPAVIAAFRAASGSDLTTAMLDRDDTIEPSVRAEDARGSGRGAPARGLAPQRDWSTLEEGPVPSSLGRGDSEAEHEVEAGHGPRGPSRELLATHRPSEHRHEHPKWFLEMGVGMGFSALRRGHAPDRLPPSTTLEEVAEHAREGQEKGADVEEIERELREEGWDCHARTAEGEIRAEDCVVAARPGVSRMEPIFDLALGYHVLPRLGVALTALVQRNHGAGPMAGVLLGIRSEVLLTRPRPRGAQLGAIAGIGVGALQARGRNSHEHGPHATNAGPGGIGASIALGAKGAYRAGQHLAFGLMPLFNIGLPYVLYDLGLTGGVEVAF